MCWVDASRHKVYFREVILPPGAEQITFKDIEDIDTLNSPYVISSCAVGVTSDGYVSILYDYYHTTNSAGSMYTKARLIDGSGTWTTRRDLTGFSTQIDYPQLNLLTVDNALYIFYPKGNWVYWGKFYVNEVVATDYLGGTPPTYGPALAQSMRVAYQNGTFKMKWSVSTSTQGGVYRYYFDTDLNQVATPGADFFPVAYFYDPMLTGQNSYGPFPSPKEIDGNYLNLLGEINSVTGAPFMNTKYNRNIPAEVDAPAYYGSDTLFNMYNLGSTMTTDILEIDGTQYWVIALRDTDSHLTLKLYHLTTFVDSTNFTEVTFYGTDDSSNNAFMMLIDEQTKKMFFLLANVSGDVPILFETAVCTIDDDCSCSHSCDDGYCRPADISQRCEDPLLPHCRYQDEKCYECLNDSHCSGNLVCDLNSFTCEICVVDDDCSQFTPACSENQECVECTNDDYCSGACDNTTNVCVECLDDIDCGDAVCNTTSNICVECSINSDCSIGQMNVCFEQQCVECVESGDCQESVPQCLISKHICVECFDDSHCTVDGEICDVGTNQCSQGCSTGADCLGSLEYCFNSEICVECLSNTNCSLNDANVCSELHQCVNCVVNGDCADGLFCNTNNECVGCLVDSDCDVAQTCDVVCIDLLTDGTEETGTETGDEDRISNNVPFELIPLQAFFLLWLVF